MQLMVQADNNRFYLLKVGDQIKLLDVQSMGSKAITTIESDWLRGEERNNVTMSLAMLCTHALKLNVFLTMSKR